MIAQQDFTCIGQVAKHCDNEKLCIAIQEALDFELNELFCEEIMIEALQHENDTDENSFWYKLWNGTEYQNACGKTKKHFGLKRIWVYYAYSRYVMINGYNDTPTGFKQKTNDFSLPTPIKELNYFEQKYRDMGYSAFKKTRDFICQNKEQFSQEIKIECEPCGCGCSDTCGGGVNTKMGLKTKIITKY